MPKSNATIQQYNDLAAKLDIQVCNVAILEESNDILEAELAELKSGDTQSKLNKALLSLESTRNAYDTLYSEYNEECHKRDLQIEWYKGYVARVDREDER